MATRTARYTRVDTVAVAATGHLTLATDQSRDEVFLKGRVRCGPALSKVMLVLAQIVKASARVTAKDHSAYQEWVEGEYLKEMSSIQAKRLRGVPQLRRREVALSAELKVLEKELKGVTQELDRDLDWRGFYAWLGEHHREVLYKLDPIVSVQEDATFFEGFSIDESVYGRVKLGHDS